MDSPEHLCSSSRLRVYPRSLLCLSLPVRIPCSCYPKWWIGGRRDEISLKERERERDRGGEEIGLKFRSKYSQVCERVFLSCEFARRGGKKKLKERSSTERKILLMAKFDVERKKPIIFHFTDRKREVPSVAQLRRSGSSPRIEGGVSHTSRRRSGYNWRL